MSAASRDSQSQKFCHASRSLSVWCSIWKWRATCLDSDKDLMRVHLTRPYGALAVDTEIVPLWRLPNLSGVSYKWSISQMSCALRYTGQVLEWTKARVQGKAEL